MTYWDLPLERQFRWMKDQRNYERDTLDGVSEFWDKRQHWWPDTPEETRRELCLQHVQQRSRRVLLADEEDPGVLQFFHMHFWLVLRPRIEAEVFGIEPTETWADGESDD